ncbi:MAG TPA: alcohol dehydrogenase catalytic domain-containing protein [Pyrinomonadaceae bacterium]|nr:alcohol dehydrogenase catalytic domain-containing protein [Pyrinomonadaceae bacterium]
MKALRTKGGTLSLDDIPRPQANEAVVRLLRSGICNTDLEIARGYAGFEGTLGHEFVGVVESAADAPVLIGKRVVGEINVGCGSCDLCLSGDPRHCPGRTVLGIKGRDGAHAEFLTLPSRNLLIVPDNISNDAAAFVEPLAAAWGITERVNISAETRVAVIGDGKLGLLSAMALSLESQNTVLIGKHRSKLERVADYDIESHLTSDAPKMHNVFDVVVEASGSESGFAMALDLVRPKGTIVLKSTFHGTPAWEAWRVVVDEITVVGSRCGRFGPALDLLSEGKVRVDNLISDKLPLAQAVRAMELSARSGVLKILLDMEV